MNDIPTFPWKTLISNQNGLTLNINNGKITFKYKGRPQPVLSYKFFMEFWIADRFYTHIFYSIFGMFKAAHHYGLRPSNMIE